MSTFEVKWQEDGSATALARIAARNGSGSATGVDGEGNWLQQADISTITFKVFDLDSDTPGTATESGSVTIVTSVLDTPVTAQTIWTKDTTGYNFLHDLPATYFPSGNRRYQVEYKVTLTGGGVFHGIFTGTAQPVRGS